MNQKYEKEVVSKNGKEKGAESIPQNDLEEISKFLRGITSQLLIIPNKDRTISIHFSSKKNLDKEGINLFKQEQKGSYYYTMTLSEPLFNEIDKNFERETNLSYNLHMAFSKFRISKAMIFIRQVITMQPYLEEIGCTSYFFDLSQNDILNAFCKHLFICQITLPIDPHSRIKPQADGDNGHWVTIQEIDLTYINTFDIDSMIEENYGDYPLLSQEGEKEVEESNVQSNTVTSKAIEILRDTISNVPCSQEDEKITFLFGLNHELKRSFARTLHECGISPLSETPASSDFAIGMDCHTLTIRESDFLSIYNFQEPSAELQVSPLIYGSMFNKGSEGEKEKGSANTNTCSLM